MTITARYAGTCPHCQQPIAPGETVSWQRGQKATHVTCPTQRAARSTEPIAIVAGGAKIPAGRNRMPARCEHCDESLAPGQGTLVSCIEDSGCLEHHDESGWHVYCADTDACRARVQRAREERTRAKAVRAAGAEAWARALAILATPAETIPTWTPLRTVRATAPRMIHTGAYERIAIGDTQSYYRAPGYFACDWDYPAITRVVTLDEALRADLTVALDAAIAAGIAQEEERA